MFWVWWIPLTSTSGNKALTLATVLPAIPGFEVVLIGLITGTGASGDILLVLQ